MRPTREETDLEYWANAVAYWKQKMEDWFILTASPGTTPEDSTFFQKCEDNAREQAFRAELKFQEAQGLITVYTGRAKPEWM